MNSYYKKKLIIMTLKKKFKSVKMYGFPLTKLSKNYLNYQKKIILIL